MNTKENLVNRLSTGLKRERLAYKIVGIVSLVLAILLVVIGVISMVSGAFLASTEASMGEVVYSNDLSGNFEIIDGDSEIIFDDGKIEINDDDAHIYIDGSEIEITDGDVAVIAGAGIIAVSGFYIGLGCSLLAIAIVNLVMASKVGKYRSDETLTIKHASSVGSIVMAALFNEIALIFVIINFVVAKKNRAALEG